MGVCGCFGCVHEGLSGGMARLQHLPGTPVSKKSGHGNTPVLGAVVLHTVLPMNIIIQSSDRIPSNRPARRVAHVQWGWMCAVCLFLQSVRVTFFSNVVPSAQIKNSSTPHLHNLTRTSQEHHTTVRRGNKLLE